jgi:predicted metalloendopeptidase
MLHTTSSFSIFLVFSGFILGCTNHPSSEKETVERKTLALQFIDAAVKPGDNFFLYANGNWYDTATILPTESRAGARLEMDFRTKENIKSILQEAAASTTHAKGSIEQQVGDLFASGMDTTAIESAGYQPCQTASSTDRFSQRRCRNYAVCSRAIDGTDTSARVAIHIT